MNQSRPLAVVTGARRGIGASIAIELATRGFNIAITDIDTTGAETTIKAIQDYGALVKLFTSDVGCIETHADLIADICEWGGPIACLINNAGIPAPNRGDLLDVRPESFDRVMNVNLRGTFFLTQLVSRHMSTTQLDHPRSIVTISSVSVDLASIERGEYCISKSGLGMLTKLFALRLAPLGIPVFEVRPGIIRTAMTDGVAAKYDQRIADGLVPMHRWGHPMDVALTVAALVDGKLGFSTGSVINVDGALSIPKL
jgi:NAD(P)-dependent dehydrogenase (short-subunit alcohol dehydrogenase family)